MRTGAFLRIVASVRPTRYGEIGCLMLPFEPYDERPLGCLVKHDLKEATCGEENLREHPERSCDVCV